MTIEDVKDVLCGLAEAYFTGANVAWDRTSKAMPKVPLVCLDLGVQRRNYQSISEIKSGGEGRYIEVKSTFITVPWTVELFTHGEKCVKDGHTYKRNTALTEINGFVDYMDSDVVLDTLNSHGIAAVITGQITDTTAVHDNDYEFRAKVEFEVSCMMTGDGEGKEIGIIEHAEVEEEVIE